MIFDTHAHYDDSAFDSDREAVLSSLFEKGIGHLVNVGADMNTSRASVELAQSHPFIYAAVGVHPSSAAELNEDNLEMLRQMATNPKVVAIGEIGLDYHWPEPDPQLQKYWFERQLSLALSLDLPVIIHSRDAAADTLEIIKKYHEQSEGALRGVIHCFSSGPEIAKEYTDRGFFIGIGGVVTFKNGKKMKEVAASVPLSQIVTETDCPYLAPDPYRKNRNDSGYLPLVVGEIAALRGLTVEEVVAATEENAKNLYRLSY